MNFHASVDIKSPRLAALALGIVAAHKTSHVPGLRPLTLKVKPGDTPELHSLAVRLTGFSGLTENVQLWTAEEFEKAVRHDIGLEKAIVIVDGQHLSKAIQARMAAQGLPGSVAPPPLFMVAIPNDPGDLVQEDRWALPFRAIFHRHWPWPKIGERKPEWAKLFRSGIESAAQESETPVPEVDPTALGMVRSLPIRDEDGARALIRIGIKAFGQMQLSGENRIRSPHVLVSLPGTSSPPPAQEEQQQASAS